MSERTPVLGADDPEMGAIVALLAQHEVPFYYAAADGKRCVPRVANEVDGILTVDEELVGILGAPYDKFVFVECRPKDVPLAEKHDRLEVIDHHDEGDPGYDLVPADYWRASSLGQMAIWLTERGKEVSITQEMRVIAAMDHCRQAAIRGECPGVSAEEVVDQRVISIVERHGLTPEVVRDIIDGYAAIFKECETIPFGSGEVIDFTHQNLGLGYSADFLCAQTALDKEGLVALIRNSEPPGPSKEKIMITGHPTKEMLAYFMEEYAITARLENLYGAPERGYAGGYLPAA